jgi:hypothetical protein
MTRVQGTLALYRRCPMVPTRMGNLAQTTRRLRRLAPTSNPASLRIILRANSAWSTAILTDADDHPAAPTIKKNGQEVTHTDVRNCRRITTDGRFGKAVLIQ